MNKAELAQLIANHEVSIITPNGDAWLTRDQRAIIHAALSTNAANPNAVAELKAERDALQRAAAGTVPAGYKLVRDLNYCHAASLPSESAAVQSSELERLREFERNTQEAEGRVCPEDVGFEEYIRHLLSKLALAAEDIAGLEETINNLRSNGGSAKVEATEFCRKCDRFVAVCNGKEEK